MQSPPLLPEIQAPSHLDSIPPLLLSLSVCTPPPVFVGLLVGLLLIVTVLIIYAQMEAGKGHSRSTESSKPTYP